MAKFEVLITSRSQNVAALLLLAVLPAIIISYSYQVILQSIGIETSVAVLMLIVPMVWIVRLLPISLGGIGLGEGAFVLLAALAGMDRERAFAAALAVLGIQIAWSLIGGLLVVRSGLKRAFAAAQPSE